jgi:hypothetical protein
MTDRASLDRIVEAAERAGANPRPAGSGRYRATAVCHGGNRTDTLSIRWDAAKGFTYVKCFKGCDRDQILWVLDLSRAEQWDEPAVALDPNRPREPRTVVPLPPGRPPVIFEPARHGWTPPVDLWMPCGHTKLDEYLYCDEARRILYGVARCTSKHFAQWRPDLDKRGGRRWSLAEKDQHGRVAAKVRLVPYRLPELIEAAQSGRRLFVVEGEKDCHALVSAGQTATCNKGGAGEGWHGEYTPYFTGARVTIVADRDTDGRKHAESIVQALMPVAASIEVVVAATGKDSADHLAAGGTPETFQTVWIPKEPTP